MTRILPHYFVLLISLYMGATISLPIQKRSVSSNGNCGRENPHPGPNYEISGGTGTRPHQYPWMVRLDHCGGSLISDRHVLTAKHCLSIPQKWAKVGVHNRHDASVYQEIPIIDKMWPDYDDHDIAILILAEPVTFTDNIRRICLPAPEEQVYVGNEIKTLGWGLTGLGSEESAELLEANLTLSDSIRKNYIYTEVKIIDGEPVDPCNGDSGGPLMHQDSITGIWTIFGTLTGGGYNCQEGRINGDGQWNKVTTHIDWINEILDQGQGGTHRCPRFTRGQAIGGSEIRIGFHNQNGCIEECKNLSGARTATIDFTATDTTAGACYCGFGERTIDFGSTHPESVNYKTCFL